MNVRNPFKNLKLDQEEQEINQAVESGKVKLRSVTPAVKKKMVQIANYTLNKIKNVNLRLSERDLSRLKVKAMEEGIPYQTLIGSIIHKYVAAGGS